MGFSFKDFFNKISNDNRIFTYEEISHFTKKQMSEFGDAVDYQLKYFGSAPKFDELIKRDALYSSKNT